MRCPKEKELALLYYQDLSEKESGILREHLRVCAICRRRYTALGDFLSGVKQEPVSLKGEELSAIMEKVKKANVSRNNLFFRVKDNFNYFLQGVRWKLFYRPQIAFAAILLFIGIFFLPLHRQQALFEQGAVGLQLELISGDDYFDIFLEFYND